MKINTNSIYRIIFLGILFLGANAQATWTGEMAVECGFGYLNPQDTSGDEFHRCHYTGRDLQPNGQPWPNPNTDQATVIGGTYFSLIREVAWPPTRERKTATRTVVVPFLLDNFDAGLATECSTFAGWIKQVGMGIYKPLGSNTWTKAASDSDLLGAIGGDPFCVPDGLTIITEVVQPDLNNHPVFDFEVCLPDEDGDGNEECVIVADGAPNGPNDGPGAGAWGDVYYECINACSDNTREQIIWDVIGAIIRDYFETRTVEQGILDNLGYSVGLEYGVIFRKVVGTIVSYDLTRFSITPDPENIDPISGSLGFTAGDFNHMDNVYSYNAAVPPGASSFSISPWMYLYCHQPQCALWGWNWPSVEFSTSTRIERASSPSGPWTLKYIVATNGLMPHLDIVSYYWRARAENGYGVGPWSAVQYTAGHCPPPPGGGRDPGPFPDF